MNAGKAVHIDGAVQTFSYVAKALPNGLVVIVRIRWDGSTAQLMAHTRDLSAAQEAAFALNARN